LFCHIISVENLFLAWHEFCRGKKKKLDVAQFEFNLEDNIFQLHKDLISKTYKHSVYKSFYVRDPKLRHIHKACVRDRVLHQAIFRILYPVFDRNFIFDSYSCRFKKGTHRAVNHLNTFARKCSQNWRKDIFVLKCDVRKFFGSINKGILLNLIKRRVEDENVLWLIKIIIDSFNKESDEGLPLGNVTSQLFSNIYLNELDWFIKRQLKEKYYIRYCDDFVLISKDKSHLENVILVLNDFLLKKLKLFLHPDKISIRKYNQGIDFLGYVNFSHFRTLRTKTKRRIFRKIKLLEGNLSENSLQSYLGILDHCNGYKLGAFIKEKCIGKDT
jgi:retron-type reverse transcriptase